MGLIPHVTVGTSDLFDVKNKSQPVTARWKHIGLALRLDPGQLNTIERGNRDLDDCLTEMLTLWLKKNYNTERFGEPSWELLARAVAHPAGGNDSALAKEISEVLTFYFQITVFVLYINLYADDGGYTVVHLIL